MATISNIFKYSKSYQLKSIAIYTFSNFFNKGISFLLLFYFAHVLTESDFGILNLFSNSILFLMPFISMGILQSANTEFFKLEKNEFKNFFSTTLLMPIVVMVLSVILLFIFKNELQQRYPFPAVFILLIPVITLFTFLNEHLINMVRNSNDPVKYLFINIGRLLAEITLAVFFISALQYGWIGRVMGIFLSFLFVAGYAFVYFKEQQFLFGKIQKKYIYDELLYSVPIIVMQISVFCMGSSAGYFIEHFTHDYAAVGVFSIAATFGSIIIVLCTALLQYVYPKIYSLLSEKQVDYSAIRKHFLFYAGGMLLGTVAVIIATPLAYKIVLKPSYHAGLSYYFFICIGYFFWSISYFFYAFMLYHKQKRKILAASLLSVMVSSMSHYFFIKQMGAYGAAVSMSIVYFIVLIITVLFVYKQIVPILRSKKTAEYYDHHD
jgi:O-antigen/teichoic acid export membrane protein